MSAAQFNLIIHMRRGLWASDQWSQPLSLRCCSRRPVPVAQLAALVVSLYVFNAALERLPDGFTLGGAAQSNADVIMHAFVVFVLMLGPLVFTKVFLQR
jgi:hypothetical protein